MSKRGGKGKQQQKTKLTAFSCPLSFIQRETTGYRFIFLIKANQIRVITANLFRGFKKLSLPYSSGSQSVDTEQMQKQQLGTYESYELSSLTLPLLNQTLLGRAQKSVLSNLSLIHI